MKTIPINTFQTTDLSLCTTLCLYEYHIEAIDRANKSKIIFSFKGDEELNEIIQKFWRHELRVEPISFFNMTKEIKQRIYNQ